MSVYQNYETVIGLEVHVQLGTVSKAFCADSARYGNMPNTQISPISLAHPGTLPRLNKLHVEYAVRLGLALGCTIHQENRFDRKNYFYADLPKGYQISQDALPICTGGEVSIKINGVQKNIPLVRIHMEEDAGKSIHDFDPMHSLIDLNRAGVPLLEIVSAPALHSPDEAAAYISEIRKLVRYLDISDGNMEQGSLRCDCNVSVRLKGTTTLGTRCEIKNINSMRYAKRAIEYETKRQIDIIEAGGRIEQQTLDFNPMTGQTTPLRDKEDAHDYRYFPDPDLPPVILTTEYIEQIRQQLPPLPNALIQQFTANYKLSAYDAELLTAEKEFALYYLAVIEYTTNYKVAANWLINVVRAWLNEQRQSISDFPLSPATLADLVDLVAADKVSKTVAAQQLFPVLIREPKRTPLAVAEELQLLQNSEVNDLQPIIEAALAKYPDKVEAYHKGKKGLLGLFMGEVMRNSKGKVNPKVANRLLQEQLDALKP